MTATVFFVLAGIVLISIVALSERRPSLDVYSFASVVCILVLFQLIH